MKDWILQNESTLRLIAFTGVFFVIALWEWISPKRKRLQSLTARWVNNLALVVINTLLVRLLFPMAAVGIALIVSEQQMGLLNLIEIHPIATVTLSVILLDCAIYWQHRLMHKCLCFGECIEYITQIQNLMSLPGYVFILWKLSFR